MASPLSAHEQAVSKIFGGDYVFEIPGFQRPYSLRKAMKDARATKLANEDMISQIEESIHAKMNARVLEAATHALEQYAGDQSRRNELGRVLINLVQTWRRPLCPKKLTSGRAPVCPLSANR